MTLPVHFDMVVFHNDVVSQLELYTHRSLLLATSV